MEDLIKREDAIKAVSEPFDRKYWQYTTRSIRDTVKALKEVPSAEPTVDKDYLVRLIQGAVYDGEDCKRLMEMVEPKQGDLISREDAIKAIFSKPACHGSDGSWYHSDDIRDAINSTPSADRPQGEWIPCSERLPEPQVEVLYSLEGCVSVAFMTNRNYTGETVELHWEDLETGITICPEAWMPLPEPWEGADDERHDI